MTPKILMVFFSWENFYFKTMKWDILLIQIEIFVYPDLTLIDIDRNNSLLIHNFYQYKLELSYRIVY
jgi:hypothetical protein